MNLITIFSFLQLKSEVKTIGNRHRAEMSQVDRQLQERRNQASAEEDSMKKEIHSLKSIITNLEDRLGKGVVSLQA